MSLRLLIKRKLFLYSIKRQFEFRYYAVTSKLASVWCNKSFKRIGNRNHLVYCQYNPSVMACSIAPETNKQPNRLAKERSPYLLQHAYNPVDWHPWGNEAFEKAASLNRPIFLSIGYSTCHWCHVMEHESFENEEIAQFLKDNFIAIKLDREERPDLDKIYMSYVQRVTGSGGWPLTLFLTPTLEPMYGGTYFPPDDAFNRVGLKTLLRVIAEQWKDEHELLKREAQESVKRVKAEVSKRISSLGSEIPGSSSWEKCFQQLHNSYETNYGGFSNAPKFPQCVVLNFLLVMHGRYKDNFQGQKSKEMVLFTLERMAYGGIHDHVGSGFARYSVDKRWHVPHFEKMLYDQSQLVMVYLDAFLIGKQEMYSNVAKSILKYVDRDLSHKLGGFYSAEDADSLPTADSKKKKEGAFYVWTMDEIVQLLTNEKDRDIFCYHFDVKQNGNVDPRIDPHQELKRQNVLFCEGSLSNTATNLGLSVSEVQNSLQACLDILYEARSKRPRPSVDTKIVTAWNGLMIAAYAKAAFILHEKIFEQRAIEAANFVRNYLRTQDGSLLRCCYGNGDSIEKIENPIDGLLDDYAFLIRGLIYLYECTFDGQWLVWAEELQSIQDQKFWDSENGSYFNSLGNDAYAIVRDKEDQDGAEPCGNSVSVHNLITLANYLDNATFRENAKQIFRGYSKLLNVIPVGLPEMASALIHFHTTPHQIIIAGERDQEDTQALLKVVREQFLPGRIIMIADGVNGKSEVLYKRHKALENIRPVQGRAAAYVCKQFACTLPTTKPEDLAKSLSNKSKENRPAGTSSSSSSD